MAALLCAATGALAFSARAVWGQQATFDVVSRENVMVPMRDGVKLATDVYLPARNGKPIEGRWPTVLIVAGVFCSLFLIGALVGIPMLLLGIYMATARETISCCSNCGHYYKVWMREEGSV